MEKNSIQKLYDIPRNQWIVVMDEEPKTPISSLNIEEHEVLFFHHIDGMYSLCEDKDGNIKHLSAMTNVKVVTDLIGHKFGQPNIKAGQFR